MPRINGESERVRTPKPQLLKQECFYSKPLPDGLVPIYIVPAMASNNIGTLKSKLYGARKMEMSENVHMKANDIIFAFSGITPVFRNDATCRPKKRLLITKL